MRSKKHEHGRVHRWRDRGIVFFFSWHRAHRLQLLDRNHLAVAGRIAEACVCAAWSLGGRQRPRRRATYV